MEMRIDNLQMDMTGVELSVANAHLQVQRVEEETQEELREMKHHFEESEARQYLHGGGITARLDSLELERTRVEANCATVREVLSSWMVSFEALEKSIADESTRVVAMEDHLAERSMDLHNFGKKFEEKMALVERMQEWMDSQDVTIMALKDRVGELELGRHLLRDRIIAIEVRRYGCIRFVELTIYFL